MNEEQLKAWHDAIIKTMAKYDCNTIEEVYRKGRNDERRNVEETVERCIEKHKAEIRKQVSDECIKAINDLNGGYTYYPHDCNI